MTRKTREWRPSSFRPAPHPSSFQPERSGGPESRGAEPSGDSRLRGNDERENQIPAPRLRGDRLRGNDEKGCGFPPPRE